MLFLGPNSVSAYKQHLSIFEVSAVLGLVRVVLFLCFLLLSGQKQYSFSIHSFNIQQVHLGDKYKYYKISSILRVSLGNKFTTYI
jgi:hypothetical protein